ncbi:hypothetical protein ANO11243_050160 [Dothideomycetidae sp. 11243]|nr:hypothetical protein ANO11243_050160 [fungal sp. No.11243]
MLLAASHRAALDNQIEPANLLHLGAEALSLVQQAIDEEDSVPSDQLIGAVAKLASYEAMYGSAPAYQKHMQGLKHMISLRGGFHALGLDGLLERIVMWIDVNGSYFTGQPRVFAADHLEHLPTWTDSHSSSCYTLCTLKEAIGTRTCPGNPSVYFQPSGAGISLTPRKTSCIPDTA